MQMGSHGAAFMSEEKVTGYPRVYDQGHVKWGTHAIFQGDGSKGAAVHGKTYVHTCIRISLYKRFDHWIINEFYFENNYT